jgi:hypothetical protein
MNTFTLVIDIRGLCLFAPHDGVMHVLLPDETAAHQHEQHEMPPHVARFAFHPDYNVPGNGDPARIEVPFSGVRWDLRDIVTGAAELALPPEVIDVAQLVRGKGLERHQLRKREQMHVKSHLVLSAGAVECRGKVGRFRIRRQNQDVEVRMTSMLRWVIPNVPGTQLNWKLESLDGTSKQALDPLRPDETGIIKLDLLHAPADDIDTDECHPAKGNHFPAYYPLFKGRGPMPVCLANSVQAGECREDGRMELFPRFEAPSVFTCMLGQTKVDPES